MESAQITADELACKTVRLHIHHKRIDPLKVCSSAGARELKWPFGQSLGLREC